VMTGFLLGKNSVGSHGGRLAQRLAALREVVAAGHELLFRACRLDIKHVACQAPAAAGFRGWGSGIGKESGACP
jgi:hypothetical protein